MATAEADLLTRYVRSRDAEAFRLLVEQHQDMVFATCRRILGNAADAEDAAQDAFLQLARHADRLRPPVAAWLHRVAVRAAWTLGRRIHSQRAVALHDAPDLRASADPAWEGLKAHIDAAIAALPESLRRVTVMHYLEGVRQDDIARELGVTQSAVSKRLERGVEVLRRRLRQSGVNVSAIALAPLICAHALEKAPPTLTATLAKIGLAGVGAAGKRPSAWGSAVFVKIGLAAAALAATAGVAILLGRPGAAAPTSTKAAGALPALKTEELVKLVEAQEQFYKQSRASYELTQGTTTSASPDGVFTPNTPCPWIVGESAYDAVKGYLYLKQDLSDANGLYGRCTSAFDGNVGTFLMAEPPQNPTRFSGTVTLTRPTYLAIGPRILQPVQSAFWPIPNAGISISEMLRKGRVSDISVETVAGRETYRVTVTCPVPIASPAGVIQVQTTFRFWLDPSRNMLPVRFDEILGIRRSESVITTWSSDFREVRPGIWFPYRAMRFSPRYLPSGAPSGAFNADSIVVRRIVLGEEAQVPARVEFPKGTHVRDDVANVTYTSTGSPAKDTAAPAKEVELNRRLMVRGRAVDDAGAAVLAATVRIGLAGPIATVKRYFEGLTDEEGRFEIPALAPQGPLFCDITVSAGSDYIVTRAEKMVDQLAAGEDLLLADVVMLRANASVAGVVLCPDGKPAPHVPVFLFSTDAKSTYQLSRDASTDKQGRFRIDHVCKRPMSLLAGYGRDDDALGRAEAMGGDQNVTITLLNASAAAPE